jgi:outer membrane lipoprotein-sorting protein
MKEFISMILLSLAIATTGTYGKEKTDPENWIRDMEVAYAKIDNYAAIFHKQERVNGKLLEEETIFLKFKKPFKVYLKWIKDPYRGREALYAEGWNENRMMIYESRVMGGVTVNFDPKGFIAMKGNRHPITESGLGHLAKLIGENLRKGVETGELKIIKHGVETVYGCKTQKVELIFPKDKGRGYYCWTAIINIDVEKNLPVKVQIYDWNNTLIESYGYEDLKLNAGLTKADFDPKNPEYKFY